MESCGAMQPILLHSKIPMLEEGMHFVPSFKKEGMLPLPSGSKYPPFEASPP